MLHCMFCCVKCTLFCTQNIYIMLWQDVIGCVCVNPGRLTKGQVGGTFGRLLIQRSVQSADEKRTSPCLAAQVVRIWDAGRLLDTTCQQRWVVSTSTSFQAALNADLCPHTYVRYVKTVPCTANNHYFYMTNMMEIARLSSSLSVSHINCIAISVYRSTAWMRGIVWKKKLSLKKLIGV